MRFDEHRTVADAEYVPIQIIANNVSIPSPREFILVSTCYPPGNKVIGHALIDDFI